MPYDFKVMFDFKTFALYFLVFIKKGISLERARPVLCKLAVCFDEYNFEDICDRVYDEIGYRKFCIEAPGYLNAFFKVRTVDEFERYFIEFADFFDECFKKLEVYE